MKTNLCGLLASVAVLCAAAPARAQEWTPPGVLLKVDRSPGAEKAHHKLVSGRALTIMAAVHIAFGGALGIADFVTSRQCSRTPTCMNEGGSIPFVVPEALLLSSGAVFASAGIPMWAIGARDEKRAQAQMSVTASGLRITF